MRSSHFSAFSSASSAPLRWKYGTLPHGRDAVIIDKPFLNVFCAGLAAVALALAAGCATDGVGSSSCSTVPDTATVIKLIDTPLRDTSICLGPDDTYYMTGTIEPFWKYNEGIRLWKSHDLVHWEPLGMVWKYGSSPWHKPYLEAGKPLWAPEVHYLKGTFWLTYSMPGWDGTARTSGCGLLRSTSGKPEGPYVDVQPLERLGDEIDASLFEDTDGTVWFVWHSGKIAPMKPDMTGLAEPYMWLKTSVPDPAPNHHSELCAKIFGPGSYNHVGYEGAFLFKRNGLYYLAGAETIDGRYHCMVATSPTIKGPYSARYVAVRDAGHATFFQDTRGRWWSTFFGNNPPAPQIETPGIVPIEFDTDGVLCERNVMPLPLRD